MADGLVAVVVLSWNGRADTLACLASLGAVDYPELAVIVVDNGSVDGTGEALVASFPSVEVIRSELNLGFAGGCNLGIARALELGAGVVLRPTTDGEVDPGFVGAPVDDARRRPDAGALCSNVLYHHPPDLIWFAGASWTRGSGYNDRQRGYREHDDGRFDDLVESDRACGASMLVPRQVLEQVGVLDPALFAYSEDTDWSLRARAAGYHLYVVPSSRVWHKISVALGGRERALDPLLRRAQGNTLEVCERYAPLGRLASVRRRLVLVAAHLVQALLLEPPPRGRRRGHPGAGRA